VESWSTIGAVKAQLSRELQKRNAQQTVGKVVARCDHAPKVLKGLQRRRRQCAGEASMEVPAVDPEDAERGT
jgi:hypothetical protein